MRRSIYGWMATAMILAMAAGPLAGCKEEGAAERAGKAFDDAAEQAEEGLEDAKEELSE